MEIKEIQKYLQEQKASAWVMSDYENHNPFMVRLLDEKMLTRKIIMVIPSKEKPFLICHQIDTVFLRDESVSRFFDLKPYATWQEMLQIEKESLQVMPVVLMNYSENGLLPRVSLEDYGTISYIKSLGIQIESSADLLQSLSAVLTKEQFESQKDACNKALKIKDEAFQKIAKDLREKGHSDELDIQLFIGKRFEEEGMVYDELPIVAIGENASDPHYGPTPTAHSRIHEGDLVLIDMWAKNKEPGSVYADITWMGYCGSSVPEIYQKRFSIVKQARDGVISFLKEELPHRKVQAYEADDVARKIITDAGFGPYFIHRVGHSISDDISPHGPGANLDNYESHDFRELMEGTSFSDEPGIYAPDFGIRTETDLHIQNRQLCVVGGLQEKIIPILK